MTAKYRMFYLAIAFLAVIGASAGSAKDELAQRQGWVVLPSEHNYQTLTERVDQAAKANKIGVVTRASATVGAKKVLDKTIRGNMVVGLYHPRFAVRMLEASIAAGIEAPIRVYLTENQDGTATLSYKTPSSIFAPYMQEGGETLAALAAELDQLFAKLTREAASP
jgi:uncharacterized protein (DUF302 family)